MYTCGEMLHTRMDDCLYTKAILFFCIENNLSYLYDSILLQQLMVKNVFDSICRLGAIFNMSSKGLKNNKTEIKDDVQQMLTSVLYICFTTRLRLIFLWTLSRKVFIFFNKSHCYLYGSGPFFLLLNNEMIYQVIFYKMS